MNFIKNIFDFLSTLFLGCNNKLNRERLQVQSIFFLLDCFLIDIDFRLLIFC